MKCQPPFPKNENPPKKYKNKKTKNKKIYKKYCKIYHDML